MNRIDRPYDSVAVTDDDVHRLCDFLYRKTGMMFAQEKRYYIDRRLAERMTATG
jgi:chemotaxis protein methyltransferase CheR